jgi:ubiquinone/menaquinone biosynthesis C-methylase UbiE
MGTAGVQGELWGARARDWATLQELFVRPAYEVVFDQAGVGSGTKLLDVGCGAGLAARLAAERGARVTGIDAAATLIEIARQRVPEGDFRVGEIEELPYPNDAFDVLTSFNSFQYAGNLGTALREARRVVKAEGRSRW